MTSHLNEYIKMLKDLRFIRWVNSGKESSAEDVLLEKMDELWLKMDKEDYDEINKIPSCPIIVIVPGRIIKDTDMTKISRRELVDNIERRAA